MLGKKICKWLQHLDLIALSVPAGVLVANAAFYLQPIVRQGLIAVMLIWFGLEVINGFQFWWLDTPLVSNQNWQLTLKDLEMATLALLMIVVGVFALLMLKSRITFAGK
jgi:hypothetical protein